MKYILTLAALCINLAYGQYSLGLNLEKGNTYFLNMNSTLHFDGEMNGQKMVVNSSMSALTRFKVVMLSDLEYGLEASFDSIHISIQSPMGQMEFSTGNSSRDQDMGSGVLGSMTQKHFNITLLKNGAVSKIDNPDTSGFATMLKNFPMAEGIKKMLMMGHFKQSFNRESMKENIEKLTAIFPNKKVGLNDQWGNTIMPDSGTDNSIKTSYQLVDYHSGVATIKGHSESKLRNSQKQGNRIPASFDLKGKSESTFKVDAATGWIKEAEINRELSGQFTIKLNPGTAQGKESPVQMISTVKLSGR
jgi:hypothetical protein